MLLLQGPFDGVLGFSQGAAVAGLLCALKESAVLPPSVDFRFAAQISGFRPKDPALAQLLPGPGGGAGPPLDIASFHCFGAGDEIISADRSKSLAAAFRPVRKRETLPFPASPLPFCPRLTPLLVVPQATRAGAQNVWSVEHHGGHLVPSSAEVRVRAPSGRFDGPSVGSDAALAQWEAVALAGWGWVCVGVWVGVCVGACSRFRLPAGHSPNARAKHPR